MRTKNTSTDGFFEAMCTPVNAKRNDKTNAWMGVGGVGAKELNFSLFQTKVHWVR